MLRRLVILGCALPLVGCAASVPSTRIPADRASATEPATTVTAAAFDDRDAAPASALVFAPRVTSDAPLELSRADRQPSAFVGYEGPVVEYYQVETFDRQSGGGGGQGPFWGCGAYGGFGSYGDRYERRVYINKTGVLYR